MKEEDRTGRIDTLRGRLRNGGDDRLRADQRVVGHLYSPGSMMCAHSTCICSYLRLSVAGPEIIADLGSHLFATKDSRDWHERLLQQGHAAGSVATPIPDRRYDRWTSPMWPEVVPSDQPVQGCQRRGEMSLFRHVKMSHFLRVKVSRFRHDERLRRGWLPRRSLAVLLFDRGTDDTGLALAF